MHNRWSVSIIVLHVKQDIGLTGRALQVLVPGAPTTIKTKQKQLDVTALKTTATVTTTTTVTTAKTTNIKIEIKKKNY